MEAQVLRVAPRSVGRRRPPEQAHGDLGAEAGAQAQSKPFRLEAALGEVQRPELGIHLPEVGHRGHDPGLEHLGRQGVFDAHGHGVPGVALGVGHYDAVGIVSEHAAQCHRFRGRTPAPGRRVGLVRDEHGVSGDLVPIQPPAGFDLGDEALHDAHDVLHVETATVEGAVGHDGVHDLADGREPSLRGRVHVLHDERGAAHADNEPVATPVEGERGVFHPGVVGRRAGGEETGPEPREEAVRGDVVRGQDDDAATASRLDPVPGQGGGLGRAGACAVRPDVGPPRADVLGELGVAHAQDPEEEPPVEDVRVLGDRPFQLRDPVIQHPVRAFEGLPCRAQLREPLPPRPVVVVLLDDLREGVQRPESGGEDDAGVVLHGLGQPPTVGQPRPGRRGLVAHDQRDARVLQSFDARRDGQARHPVQRRQPVLRISVLPVQLQRATFRHKLDDVIRVVDDLEARLAVRALHQPRDAVVRHGPAHLVRHAADELLAPEDPLDVVLLEDPFGARQTQRCTGDADALHGRAPARRATLVPPAPVQLEASVQELGEELAQLDVAVGSRGLCRRVRHGRRPGDRAAGGRGRPRRGDGRRGGSRRRRSHVSRVPHVSHLPVQAGSARFDRVLAPEPEPRRVQATERPVHGHGVPLAGVVRVEGQDVVPGAEHILGEPVEHPLRARLDEDAGAGVVQRLEPVHELDGRAELTSEQVQHLRDRVGSHGIEAAGDVGHDGQARRPQVEGVQHLHERAGGRRHDVRVEGVAHGQDLGPHTGVLEDLHRLPDGPGCAPDDAFLRAVDVGDDDVAVHRLDGATDLIHGAEHGGHDAGVVQGYAGHGLASCRDRFQRVAEGDRPGGRQRTPLAQAVAHDHVRLHAVRRQEPRQRRVHRQHGGLGDGRLLEPFLGFGQGVLVRVVEEDVLGQGPAQIGRHDLVRLLERRSHDRLRVPQLPQHVDVLGPLPREEEGDLARLPAAQVHAPVPECPPPAVVAGLQGTQGLRARRPELLGIAVVHRQANRRVQVAPGRRRRLRHDAGLRIRQHRSQPLRHLRLRRAADDQRPAQRRLQPRRGTAPEGSGARRRARHREVRPTHSRAWACPCLRRRRRRRRGCELGPLYIVPPPGQSPGNVLLQHRMKVRPAEPEGAHAGTAHGPVLLPGPQLRVDPERGALEVDPRIGRVEVDAGRQGLLVEGIRRLEQAGGTGGPFQVADVGLDRAQCQRARREPQLAEDLVHHLHLGQVADAGGRAVALHQVAGLRRQPGPGPGPLHRELLTHRIGRRDALAAPVAGPAHGPDHRIDGIPVPFGVLQPLEQDAPGPLTHDEAVGAFRVRPAAGGGERADLAELHEGRRAHVGVHASGQDGVVVVLLQPFHRRAQRGHGRGARRVGHVVRPLEVVQGGDAAGGDVGQLAGHGVFRDVRDPGADAGMELFEHGLSHGRVQRSERLGLLQLGRHLGEEDADGGHEVVVAAHGVAQDHGRTLRVQRPVRVAVVVQRFPGRRDGPLLGGVHHVADLRRYGQAPAQGVPRRPAHPAPDLGVRLVRRRRVRIVVELRVPPLRRDLGHAVATVLHVLPERRGVGTIRHDRADAHDGHCLLLLRSRHSVPPGSLPGAPVATSADYASRPYRMSATRSMSARAPACAPRTASTRAAASKAGRSASGTPSAPMIQRAPSPATRAAASRA